MFIIFHASNSFINYFSSTVRMILLPFPWSFLSSPIRASCQSCSRLASPQQLHQYQRPSPEGILDLWLPEQCRRIRRGLPGYYRPAKLPSTENPRTWTGHYHLDLPDGDLLLFMKPQTPIETIQWVHVPPLITLNEFIEHVEDFSQEFLSWQTRFCVAAQYGVDAGRGLIVVQVQTQANLSWIKRIMTWKKELNVIIFTW